MKTVSQAAHADEFDQWMERLHGRFDGAQQMFTTTVDPYELWNAYIANLPVNEQQYHNCHCCRHFIQHYGGLVSINHEGITTPAIWLLSEAPALYQKSVEAMIKLVKRAKVDGVFISDTKTLGTPITGPWTHVFVSGVTTVTSRLFTIGQLMAAKKEDHKDLTRAVGEYNTVVSKAVTLLKADALYRSEKCLGVAEWLHNLNHDMSAIPGKDRRTNIIWQYVAKAPAGFCQPRSSMIGTLLDDLLTDMPLAQIQRRFADKMHPLQYQRPQAAPTVGNIEQAEKVVAQLGVATSLRRRFARLDEIQALWRPATDTVKLNTDSVFGHLKPKSADHKLVNLPAVAITWEKFQRAILPDALKIEFFVPFGNSPFTTIVTAADPDAPNILQWDNTFSWYLYNNGSPAAQFGLTAGTMVEVSAVTLKPPMWGQRPNNQGNGVIFVLKGAKDSRPIDLALFPETLKSDLHGIRSSIEAFSRAGKMEGIEDASATGIGLFAGINWSYGQFKVYTKESVCEFKIDRWD